MCKDIIGLRSVCCKFWIASSFIWRWWQYYLLVRLVQNKLMSKVRDHTWLLWDKLFSWFFYFLLISFFCVCFFILFALFPAKMIFWKFSSRFLSCLRDAFLCTAIMEWESQESFKVWSTCNWNLKPYLPGKGHLFSELGTVQIGLLSRGTCFRYRRFCMTGFICFCCNGGDSICKKAI